MLSSASTSMVTAESVSEGRISLLKTSQWLKAQSTAGKGARSMMKVSPKLSVCGYSPGTEPSIEMEPVIGGSTLKTSSWLIDGMKCATILSWPSISMVTNESVSDGSSSLVLKISQWL